MPDADIWSEQFTDEDRVGETSERADGTLVSDNAVVSYNGDAVIHFTHPTWRHDRNDPATATRVDGRKVR